MISVRVRYESGKLIPVEPLQDVEEGQELWAELEPVEGARFVTLPTPEMTPELEALLDEAHHTQGIFADNPEFDEGIESVKKDWGAWNRRLSS